MSSTLQISISNDSWQTHLLSSLRKLRSQDALCDASIITQDGETSRAHAIILAASSSVLCGLLSEGGPQYKIKLQQVGSKKVMQHILDFVYEGQITIPIKLLMEVQAAADKLKINQLSDVCSAILEEMGLELQKDVKPLDRSLAHKLPSSPCVLKLPATQKQPFNAPLNRADRSLSIDSNGCDDQAIDLSVVKTEKSDTECFNSKLNLSVKDKCYDTKEVIAKPISFVQAKSIESRISPSLEDMRLDDSDRVSVSPTVHSIHAINGSYNVDSMLKSNSDNLEDPNFTKLKDDQLAKQDISDMRTQSASPAQDEDDELIEEMVAEQLLQSRMQRGMGKQPKGRKRFHCRICDHRFTRLDNLRVHIRSIHTGKKPFRCNICDKTFTRAFTLKYHKMSHDGVKPWTCADCGRGFTRKDYHQEHIRNQICKKNRSASTPTGKKGSRTNSPVQEESHQCQICEAFLPSQESLEGHMEICGKDDSKWEGNQSVCSERSFSSERSQDDMECICDICHIRFLDRESLFVHLMEHRRQEESLKIEMIAPDAPDGSPCKISRQDEQDLESIKKQMSSKAHYDDEENKSGLKFKKNQLPSSLRELLCEDDLTSSIPSPLANHNILDLRKRVLQSDENENLTNDLGVKNHNYPLLPMKEQKFNDNFDCSQENLNTLLSLTKKPFGFVNCLNNESDENRTTNVLQEVKADSKDGLYLPPRKKTKQDQPYSCDICNARFTRGDNMRVHRRRHFNATKMFTCSECGQNFTRSSSLKTHMSAAHSKICSQTDC